MTSRSAVVQRNKTGPGAILSPGRRTERRKGGRPTDNSHPTLPTPERPQSHLAPIEGAVMTPGDCGRVYAYELISAATDPGNPDHADAVLELDRFFGDSVDPEGMRMPPLDIDEINETLAGLAPGRG
jgi:hypothetical protein